MTKEMVNQQLRNYLTNLKLANRNLKLKNYEDAVINLKNSQQYLMSAESFLYFNERQVIKKLKSRN